jgi:hypothetical protein
MDEAIQQHVDRLETVLETLVTDHEQLLGLMQQKRDLLRQGDTDGMVEVCEVENEKLQTISEREKERLTIVAALTERLDASAIEPMRLADVAEALPEPARGRLLTRRQQLRQRIEQVREQSSIARRATESLMNHVNGLVRTLTSLASNTTTYGRGGTAPEAGGAISTLNVTA